MVAVSVRLKLDQARRADAEIVALEDWLRRARIHGMRAHREKLPIRPGEMGPELLPILTLVLSSTVLAELIKALHGWLTSRRRTVAVELELAGRKIRIESEGNGDRRRPCPPDPTAVPRRDGAMSLDVDPPCSRAVLLGVSFFPRDPERLPHLPAVRNNLRDLERALADPTILGLDPRHITVVDDRPSSEMLSKLVEVADDAEDTLIVYYAGHGVPGSTSLYLTGTDSSERTIEFDGMPFDRLRRALNTSPARKKVLILDCCYSGRAIDVMGTADAMLQAGIEDLEGTYTLASSGATEASAAPAGQRHTAFTGELLRVLHEGVVDAPQTLKLNEIFRALRLALRRSPKAPEPRQCAKGTASDIDFVHNRAWRPKPASPEREPTPEGASATESTAGWQKELAERLDRQAHLIEALQRQLHEQSAAGAEKLAHTTAAQGLAEEQATFEKRSERSEMTVDSDRSAIEMLEMQKARIAELETALAELQRPPPGRPAPGQAAQSTPPFGELLAYGVARWGKALLNHMKPVHAARVAHPAAPTPAAPSPWHPGKATAEAEVPPTQASAPKRLGFTAQIFILAVIAGVQGGFFAFLVEAFPRGPPAVTRLADYSCSASSQA